MKLEAAREAGETVLLLGNEAIARGALEAGVHFASAYPGTPSSEILETLAPLANRYGIHVEWSTNEKVAVEGAAAAAWAGLRALTAMKQNGLSVALDFLTNLSHTGSGRGGLVIVVADDPYAHSSTNEQDSRPLGKFIEIPMLEPSTPQEAKDIVPYAFELSERFSLPVLIRETTRLGHCRAGVTLGGIERLDRKAVFPLDKKFYNLPRPHLNHKALHEKLERIRGEFELSALNTYDGPTNPSLVCVCSGVSWHYAREAVSALNPHIGVLKVGTLYPFPDGLLERFLASSSRFLFVEEIEPYLEESVRELAAGRVNGGNPRFYGKLTGHLPRWGEMDPDLVTDAVARVAELPPQRPVGLGASRVRRELLIPRRITFCAGCPHIASLWSIMQAIKRNEGRGFVVGDIGCYTLGVFYHDLMKSVHCMGAGIGLASGFGQLSRFGLDQPVIAVMGDSTFFHACIPALVNIRYNGSQAAIVILDNGATAMTGFQPHPGTGFTALGSEAPAVRIEDVVRGIGYTDVKVIDPFRVREAVNAVYEAITKPGHHVIIFRRECILLTRRDQEEKGLRMPLFKVDQTKCPGERCKVCTELYACPACVWDPVANKAAIDEVLCNGCGVCATICPYRAIYQAEA